MFSNINFLNGEDRQRLSFGFAGAFLLHLLILLQFMLPSSQRIMSAETFTPPTNIKINFISPLKTQISTKPPQEIIKAEPAQKKPAIKKIAKALIQEPTPAILNKIEPAAAPVQIIKPVQTPNTIPVFNKASVKGRRIQPQYPKRALRLRQEGVVWLHVLVSSNGARQDIKVHKPSQYALLNQAAVKAVKKWRFNPNFVDGRATRGWVAIPIEFRIN